jgi:ribosomal protein S6
MKLYQLTYIISPELSSEEAKNFSQEIDSLTLKKGKLIKPGSPSRRILAYPIKKQTTAYLTRSEFYLDPQEIENFKKEIKNRASERSEGEDENKVLIASKSKILRFLLLEKKILKKKPEKPRIKLPPQEGEESKLSSSAERSEAGDERSSATPFTTAREEKEPAPKKAELEKIGEKLEEILKE